MDFSAIDRLWTAQDGVQTVWTVLWLVLAAITVTLILLMYTRWGRSRPLEKCALLSLLAHALLAGIGTTVQLAGVSAGVPQADEMISLAEFTSEAAESAPAGEFEGWDEPSMSPAVGPEASLDRATPTDEPATVRQAVETTEATPIAPRTPIAASMARAEEALHEIDPPALPPARTAVSPIEQARDIAKATAAPEVSDDVDLTQPRRASTAETIVDRGTSEKSVPGEANPFAGVPDQLTRPKLPTPSELDGPVLPRHSAEGTIAAGTPGEATSGLDIAPAGITPAIAGSAGAARGNPNSHGDAAADVPDIYKGRSAPNRMQLAAQNGGSAQTEASVARALAWLAAHQSDDGRWNVAQLEGGLEPRTAGHDRQGAGIGADNGVTGLALLAFLGAGHTHLQGDYRDNVRRGLEFLLNSQDRRGSLEGQSRLFAKMYCHGMAGLALSEAYAMTGDSRLKDAVRNAAAFSAAAQHSVTGGWRYLPAQPGDNSAGSLGDMSQHGWQVMILKSAKLSGIDVSDTVLSKASKFVTSAASGKHGGLSSYRPRERVTSTMTAEALVCRWFLDMPRGSELNQEAGDQLLAELPDAQSPNYYYWYYGTLAMHEVQGEHWRRWNEAMQKTLLGSQRRGGDEGGSWDPDQIWGGYGGRTYSTALGALSLEVYYRYLPLYKPVTTAGREANAGGTEIRR
jgi:hypothetical protein